VDCTCTLRTHACQNEVEIHIDKDKSKERTIGGKTRVYKQRG
jgi:hypothetical protein